MNDTELDDDFEDGLITNRYHVLASSGCPGDPSSQSVTASSIREEFGRLHFEIQSSTATIGCTREIQLALTKSVFPEQSFHVQVELKFDEPSQGGFSSGLFIVDPVAPGNRSALLGVAGLSFDTVSPVNFWAFSEVTALGSAFGQPVTGQLGDTFLLSIDYDVQTKTFLLEVPELGFSRLVEVSSYVNGFNLMMFAQVAPDFPDGTPSITRASYDNLDSDVILDTFLVSFSPAILDGVEYSDAVRQDVLGSPAVYFTTPYYPNLSRVDMNDTWAALDGIQDINVIVGTIDGRKATIYSTASSEAVYSMELPFGDSIDAFIPKVLLAQGPRYDYISPDENQTKFEVAPSPFENCAQFDFKPDDAACAAFMSFYASYGWSAQWNDGGFAWAMMGPPVNLYSENAPQPYDYQTQGDSDTPIEIGSPQVIHANNGLKHVYVSQVEATNPYISPSVTTDFTVKGVISFKRIAGMPSSNKTSDDYFLVSNMEKVDPLGGIHTDIELWSPLDTSECPEPNPVPASPSCGYTVQDFSASIPITAGIQEGLWQYSLTLKAVRRTATGILTIHSSGLAGSFLVDSSAPTLTLISPLPKSIVEAAPGQELVFALADKGRSGLMVETFDLRNASFETTNLDPNSFAVSVDLTNQNGYIELQGIVYDRAGNHGTGTWVLNSYQEAIFLAQYSAAGLLEEAKDILGVSPSELRFDSMTVVSPINQNAMSLGEPEPSAVEITTVTFRYEQVGPGDYLIDNAQVVVTTLANWGAVGVIGNLVTDTFYSPIAVNIDVDSAELLALEAVMSSEEVTSGSITYAESSPIWVSTVGGYKLAYISYLDSSIGTLRVSIDAATGVVMAITPLDAGSHQWNGPNCRYANPVPETCKLIFPDDTASYPRAVFKGNWRQMTSVPRSSALSEYFIEAYNSSDCCYWYIEETGHDSTLGSYFMWPQNQALKPWIHWNSDDPSKVDYYSGNFTYPSQKIETMTALKWSKELNAALFFRNGVHEYFIQPTYFRQNILNIPGCENLDACTKPDVRNGGVHAKYFFGVCTDPFLEGCGFDPYTVVHEVSHGVLFRYLSDHTTDQAKAFHEAMAMVTPCLLMNYCFTWETYKSKLYPEGLKPESDLEEYYYRPVIGDRSTNYPEYDLSEIWGTPLANALAHAENRIKDYAPSLQGGVDKRMFELAWEAAVHTSFKATDRQLGRMFTPLKLAIRSNYGRLPSFLREAFIEEVQHAFAGQGIPVQDDQLGVEPKNARFIGIRPGWNIPKLSLLDFRFNPSLYPDHHFAFGAARSLSSSPFGIETVINANTRGNFKLQLYTKDPLVHGSQLACGILEGTARTTSNARFIDSTYFTPLQVQLQLSKCADENKANTNSCAFHVYFRAIDYDEFGKPKADTNAHLLSTPWMNILDDRNLTLCIFGVSFGCNSGSLKDSEWFIFLLVFWAYGGMRRYVKTP